MPDASLRFRLLWQLLVFAGIGITFCCGCSDTEIANPVFSVKDCNRLPDFFGSYRLRETERIDALTFLHVGSAGKGYPKGVLKVVTISHLDGKLEIETNFAFARKLDGIYWLHIPEFRNGKLPTKAWWQDDVVNYQLYKVKVTETGLAVHYLDDDFVGKELKNKNLNGIFKTDPIFNSKTARITATTEELFEYFTQNKLDALTCKEAIYFDRIKKQER